MSEQNLQPMENEIIMEIGNASINAVSQSLTAFVSGAVNVKAPELRLTGMEVFAEAEEKGLLSQVGFRGGAGQQFLFFPAASTAVLAALLLGKEPPEEPPAALDEMEESAMSEVVSMFLGVYTTSLSGFTGTSVEIDSPTSEYIAPATKDFTAAGLNPDEQLVVLQFGLQIEPGHEVTFYQYVPYPFMKELIAPLLPEEPAAEEAPEELPAETGDEREALLDGLQAGVDEPGDGEKEEEITLDHTQKDVLAEIGNISLGASATALSDLLNRKVQITTPEISLTTMKDIRTNYPVPCLVITVNYIKGLSGDNTLILNEEDALSIVGIMMSMEPPDKPTELGEIELSGISEAMNQMMGSAATAMSDIFERLIDISPPSMEVKDLYNESLEGSGLEDEDSPVVKIAFRMEVEGLLDSTLLQLIPLPFALEMVEFLLSKMSGEESAGAGATGETSAAESVTGTGFGMEADDQGDEEEEEGLFKDLDIFTAPAEGTEQESSPEPVAAPAATALKDYNYSRIDMIRDIPINIHVLLGKTRLPLKKIFSLLPGEVIALERYLGEAVEIYANDRLVAKGEVVVVNGQFGIKIIDMLRSK